MHLLLKDLFFLEQANRSNNKEESAIITVRREFKEDEAPATRVTGVPQTPFSEVSCPNTSQAHPARLMKSDKGTAHGSKDAGK